MKITNTITGRGKRYTEVTRRYPDGSSVRYKIYPGKTALLFAVWRGHHTLGEIARYYKAAGFGYGVYDRDWDTGATINVPYRQRAFSCTMAENTALRRLCGNVYRQRTEIRTRHDGTTYPCNVYYASEGPAYLTRTKKRGPNGNLMWHYSLTPLGLAYCQAARAISTTGNPANHAAIMDLLAMYDHECSKQEVYVHELANAATNKDEAAFANRCDAVLTDAGGYLYDMASHGW